MDKRPQGCPVLPAGRILAQIREALMAERVALPVRDYTALAAAGDEIEVLLGDLRRAAPGPGEAATLVPLLREVLALRQENLSCMRALAEEAGEERRRLEQAKLLLQVYRPGGEGGGTRLVKEC